MSIEIRFGLMCMALVLAAIGLVKSFKGTGNVVFSGVLFMGVGTYTWVTYCDLIGD